MNLVGLGLGVSLVAEHWCGVSYPGVVFRPVGEEDERVRFSLVWRPENDNPALRRFVAWRGSTRGRRLLTALLRKGPIRRHEPRQHGCDQLRRFESLAVLSGERFGIGDKIAVNICG